MKERFEKFTSLVLNINRNIQKLKSQEMEKLGMKGSQVQCVFHLYNEKDGLTSTQLCALCEEDKAAVSRALKDLEQRGYVYVDESGGRKYRNPIKLTVEGERVAKAVNEKIEKVFLVGSCGIQEKDRAKFYEQLESICANLDKICEKGREEK